MKKFLPICFLIVSSAFAQESSKENENFISLDSRFTFKMLEHNQDLRKVDIFLDEHKNGLFNNKRLIFGTSLISIIDYQRSNTDSKFGYLMRHPTSSNQIGKNVSEAVIHSFQISLAGKVNDWISTYAEILYDPEQSFGTGTLTDLNRNQLQLRKGFILLGNLEKNPYYLALGKMDSPFGQTNSVSPFTNSTMWHAFGGLAFGAQIGLHTESFDASFMAIQGGAQFRALSSPVRKTNVPSRINNFTTDANYSLKLGENAKVKIGGSYLYGSTYNQDFPVQHFHSGSENNPAYSVYGRLDFSKTLQIQGSFAKTFDEWPGTHNPNPPLDVYEASKVSSLDCGAKYTFNPDKIIEYCISGEFSNFTSGPNGSPWERQNQIVLGFSGLYQKSSKFFVEVFRTDGFVPLNFLSGGNLPPGETISVNGAFSHGIVVGGQITF